MSPNNLLPFPDLSQDNYDNDKNPELDKLWDRILENEDRMWYEIDKVESSEEVPNEDDDDTWFLIF